MPRVAKKLECTKEQIEKLTSIVNAQISEQRMVRRAKIILHCIEGMQVKDIAQKLDERPNTIIKWRDSYREHGIEGLYDAHRSGRAAVYGKEFRDKVLSKINETPPGGMQCWDGATLAAELDASPAAVWRLLRKEGICLSRRRTWCISTDPEFAPKSADIVGLYLNPPEKGVVICVDEKPSIQALSRATGYVKTGNGKIVRAIKSTYRRNGTKNLFAALEVATGKVFGKTTEYKRRCDFLEFMDDLLRGYDNTDGKEYHVIMDNYCIHKKNDEWLKSHPNVHFHYTPTSASWLNQVEIWFNIFTRKVLNGASFDTTDKLCEAIAKYIAYYNENRAEPFVWKKREVSGSQLRDTIANLCN